MQSLRAGVLALTVAKRIHLALLFVPPSVLLFSSAFAGSHTEDFTTTLYKDTANTTAFWDTASGELKLYPFVPALVGSCETPGVAMSIVVAGDLAFVADGVAGLQIVDITDPAGPSLVGACDTPGRAYGIVVAGDLAFIADGDAGLQIVDITDPAGSFVVGTCDTPGSAYGVAVAGDLAFVADYDAGIQVVDIANPAAPSLVGACATPGNAYGVAAAGDLAFVADGAAGLQILEILFPLSPAIMGSVDTPGDAWGVAVAGDLAFVADGTAGLQIADITSPAYPAIVGSFDTPGNAHGIVVTGDLALVADQAHGLQIVDLTNPASPALISTCDTPGSAYGIAAAGDLCLVADSTSGLQIARIADLAVPPVLLGTCAFGYASEVAVTGDLALVAEGGGGLRVVDISDPANPSAVGACPGVGSYSGQIVVTGNLAFLANNQCLLIVDITDPAHPSQLGVYFSLDYVSGVAVAGDLAFVTGQNFLEILDISDPTSPSLVTAYPTTGGEPGCVAVAGDLAFITRDFEMEIVDISNPPSPGHVGTYSSHEDYARGVVVSGDLALIGGYNAVQIVDISDPANPSYISMYYPEEAAKEIAVAGDFAFVADWFHALEIVDISNPASPVRVDSYTLPLGYVLDVEVAGNLAFVANGDGGLQIFQVFQCEVDASGSVGRSLTLDSAEDPILKARIVSNQTGDVAWELSADGGANFQAFTPGDDWSAFTTVGTDLLWRTAHTWAPGLNPTVSEVAIEWLNEYGLITSISDIPNDQGRQVRLTWTRSSHDFVGDPEQIVEYAVYRRIDPDLSTAVGAALPAATLPDGSSPIVRQHAEMMEAAGWDFLGAIPVLAEDSYSVVVPTLADSTIVNGQYFSVFRVTALTGTPGIFFHSPPDSGYSVDNLAPGVPEGFTATAEGGGVALSWSFVPEPDFQYFRVYRSTDPEFDPGPETLVHQTTATSWWDASPDPGSVYYKLTALDHAGNESAAASSGSVTAVGGGPGPRTGFTLQAAVPNPFNPRTTLRFALAEAGDVSIRIFDVAGRQIRELRLPGLPAGWHDTDWDGRDETGRRVASGSYVVRLEAANRYDQIRVLLLK